MKLTTKFTLAFLVGIVAILAASSTLRVRREIRFFEAEMQRDHQVLGRALAAEVASVWAREGSERALELVRLADVERRRVTIRWVWIDAPPGDPHAGRARSAALEGLTRGVELSWNEPDEGEGGRLTSYFPVRVPGGRVGAIEVSESRAGERQYIRTTVVEEVVETLAIAVVSVALAAAIGAWTVGRPVGALLEKVRRVARGDLTLPVEIRQRDELRELGCELNAMCERLGEARSALLAAHEQLRHADRLATVGTLASGIAHELGTPLNVVQERGKMIRSEKLPPADVAENAGIIVEQCERMARIIRELLAFARNRSPRRAPEDLVALARRTLALLEPLLRKRRVDLELTGPDDGAGIAPVDAALIEQVLTNVVMNGIQAIQARPGPGRLRVRVARERARPPADPGGPERECVRIDIADDGVGIPAEARPRIFEPFFTTKGVGEGTGLGLSVAHGIVRDHGGWLSLETEVGKGSRFSIFLPAQAP